MEVKKYVIDLSLSDGLKELKDSFFDDIAFVKYSDHKAVVKAMQNKIDELEKLNKSLECCGNCKWYAVGHLGEYCDREDNTLCIKWNPSEPGAVNLWTAKGIK